MKAAAMVCRMYINLLVIRYIMLDWYGDGKKVQEFIILTSPFYTLKGSLFSGRVLWKNDL